VLSRLVYTPIDPGATDDQLQEWIDQMRARYQRRQAELANLQHKD
jgi:Tfp pilus assembly protein PilP